MMSAVDDISIAVVASFVFPSSERTLSRLPQQLNPRNLSHDDGPKISCTRGETKQHVLERGHMPLLGEHIALNMTMTP